MRTIRQNAQQVLTERFKNVENATTLYDYAKLESQSDPGFYRWLFNDDTISDFGSNLSEEEMDVARKYMYRMPTPITYENYKKLECCYVIDDNNDVLEIANYMTSYTLSDKDKQHSIDFITYSNNTTIQYSDNGCFYVSQDSIMEGLQYIRDNIKDGLYNKYSDVIDDSIKELFTKEVSNYMPHHFANLCSMEDLIEDAGFDIGEISEQQWDDIKDSLHEAETEYYKQLNIDEDSNTIFYAIQDKAANEIANILFK